MFKICVEAGGSLWNHSLQQSHPVFVAAIKDMMGMIILDQPKGIDGIINRVARMAATRTINEAAGDFETRFGHFKSVLTEQWDKEEQFWVFGLRVWLNPVRSVGYCGGEWELTYRD